MNDVIRCKRCVMPLTRPDTGSLSGVCAACLTRAEEVDWGARKEQLVRLLDRHEGRVLVPSSGGKDSTYQALTLLEMGADVTCVTARTCHLTPIGRENIDNLARRCRTIEVTPNMTVRSRLNRLGLELVGDISWPEHAAIFSTPFRVAQQMGHTLIMYGENPQNHYGGPPGSAEAKQMTARWITEFGGFLGLRPADLIGSDGITERDMEDYTFPPPLISAAGGRIEAHFLGQYLPWDSRRNAEVANAAGMNMPKLPPCTSNWWNAENLDNAQTGLHDWFGWLKYRYSRGTAQISADIRAGHISRERALVWVQGTEALFPHFYAGVHFHEVLDRIGMPVERFKQLEQLFTNKHLHGAQA
jgi:hypothetical protein